MTRKPEHDQVTGLSKEDKTMSDKTKAFPVSHTLGYQEGMELRDWFAGQALNGLCANIGKQTSGDEVAKAYRLADAMMSARGEK